MPNLPKLLAKNFKKYGKPIGVKSATLIKVTNGARTGGSISAGTNPTETNYPCLALVEHYSTFSIANSLATAQDRKISIFGGSLPTGVVPTSGDKVIAEGVTYHVQELTDRDPAGAMYTVKARA